MASAKRQFRAIFHQSGVDWQGNPCKPFTSKTYSRVGDAKSWLTRTGSYRKGSGWVEYVDTVDWKRWDDSLGKDAPAAVEESHKRGVTISLSDSWAGDGGMPLGHMYGTKLYEAICVVYDQAQANGEVPGKLIIESSKNTTFRTTDFQVNLYTKKVE